MDSSAFEALKFAISMLVNYHFDSTTMGTGMDINNLNCFNMQ